MLSISFQRRFFNDFFAAWLRIIKHLNWFCVCRFKRIYIASKNKKKYINKKHFLMPNQDSKEIHLCRIWVTCCRSITLKTYFCCHSISLAEAIVFIFHKWAESKQEFFELLWDVILLMCKRTGIVFLGIYFFNCGIVYW